MTPGSGGLDMMSPVGGLSSYLREILGTCSSMYIYIVIGNVCFASLYCRRIHDARATLQVLRVKDLGSCRIFWSMFIGLVKTMLWELSEKCFRYIIYF